MPEVVAKIALEYAGKHREAGERFEMEERHVRLLVAIGRIEDPTPPKPAPAAPAVGTYRTRDIAASPVAKATPKRRNRQKIIGASA